MTFYTDKKYLLPYQPVLIFLCCLLVFTVKVPAQQTNEEKINAYLDVAVKNAQELKKYAWTMKVSTNEKAGQQTIRNFQMQYGKDGRLTRTETTPADQIPVYTGATDWTLKLVDLMIKYLSVPVEKLGAFYRSSEAVPDAGGLIELSGEGFMEEADRVTIDIDKVIYIIRRMTFTTVIDEDDVMGTVEYEVDAQGLKYPARIKVDVPAKRLNIVMENSGFIKI